MQILFIASIYGRKKYLANYQKIVDLARAAGHTVLADQVLKSTPEAMAQWDPKQDLDFHTSVIEMVNKADAVFVELSYTSTSIGYLLALAIERAKPVVIFYGGDEEPHILKTLEKTHDLSAVIRYRSLDEIEKAMPSVLEFVTENQDVRFNFFLTPKLSSYLDWVAKNQKIPRSVFLRRLIDNHMQDKGK